MTRLRGRLAALGTITYMGAWLAGATARADPGEGRDLGAAQALFDLAMQHLRERAFDRACPEFEEVVRLVPQGLGARLRLAECYEGAGRHASAWATYTACETMAKLAGQGPRAAFAKERAALLKPRLLTLTIVVPESARSIAHFRVLRDGRALGFPEWGVAVPLDAGTHVVSAAAPGRKPWQSRVELRESERAVVVRVPELAADPFQMAPAGAPPNRESSASSGGAPVWVWPLGGAGLVLMGVGIGFAIDQQTIQGRIDANCPIGSPCTPGFDARGANARLHRDFGLFLGFGIAGVVATGVAVIGWATAPAKAPRAAARAHPGVATSRGWVGEF
jgi:hypothetical protein